MSEDFLSFYEHAFIYAFENSLPDEMVGLSVERCEFKELEIFERAILLTVSSLRFRSILILHYSKETVDFLKKIDGINEKSDVDDYLSEMMNTMVGIVKRKLQVQISSLGMSTPNVLDNKSSKYVNSTKVDHQLSLHSKRGRENVFGASIHTSIYGPLELLEKIDVDAEETGGLELF